MAKLETVIVPGDTVLIERDEKLYPSRGSWPKYVNRLGTVCTINSRDAEYGIAFGSTRLDADGNIGHGGSLSWFRLHEMTRLDAG